jgi:hypothetical protein
MITRNPRIPLSFTFCNLHLILGTNFVGVVDFGLGESSEQAATHALVFMVVALNGSFKIPIAHFFTTGIKGAQA